MHTVKPLFLCKFHNLLVLTFCIIGSAYKDCIKSNNGLRKWTNKHLIISCHTTTPHDIAFARQKGSI